MEYLKRNCGKVFNLGCIKLVLLVTLNIPFLLACLKLQFLQCKMSEPGIP